MGRSRKSGGAFGLGDHAAAEATAAQDAALWRQSVIGAVQNVADVLTALRDDADLLGDDLAAEEAAKRALDLAQMQYRLGGIALLTVLQSEIAYETALIALVRAQASRFSDSAALFVAVASSGCGCEDWCASGSC